MTWEEVVKKWQELTEEIEKAFPDCYLDIGSAYNGTNAVFLYECKLKENYPEDKRKNKIRG